MTTITNTRELPWCPLRAYSVKDEAEAAQIAGGRKSYLFRQTEDALYLYVETQPIPPDEPDPTDPTQWT